MSIADMIDIHAHILPGVDDGARSVPEALDMLKMAESQGVTVQYLTPHIHFGRYPNTKAELEYKFQAFRDTVAKHDIGVELRLGAELRIGPELIPLAQSNAIPTITELHGKKLFLLEFPRSEIPHGSEKLIYWLINAGYLPIIVHPERNATFLRRPEKLKRLRSMGCPVQITASSLTGKFGEACQRLAITLLKQNDVYAVASDCHNLKGRRPDLLDAKEYAASLACHFPTPRVMS